MNVMRYRFFSLQEAKEWYKGLTGIEDDDLYKDEEVAELSFEHKV